MFECKYKYQLEDSIKSAKYVYRSGKRTRDKVIAIMLPILIAVMVGLLIVDIVNKKSMVLDIVLLCALVLLEMVYIIMPFTIVWQQKKAFKKQKLDEMDLFCVSIDASGLCTEKLLKNGEEVDTNVHSLKSLTSYIEDDKRIVLVFNGMEYVCLRKENLTGGVDKLKQHLEKCMSKTSKRKK